MELTKFQASEILYHIKHDLRQLPEGKTYGNESVDTSLSYKNERLIDRGNTAEEVNKYRKALEKEIFKYNRKNLVHAVEVVIQCPSDCPAEQQGAFFRESLEYIASTLPRGKKDIFVAEIHRDEKHYSPSGELISKDHLHIMYVPAVKDTKHEGYEYKLCADALTKRADLRRMHPELQAHLDSKGIQATVFRKKEGDGKAVALSVKQLKELTAKTGIVLDKPITVDELATIISSNISYSKQLKTAIASIHSKDAQLTELTRTVEHLETQVREKNSELLQSKTADKEKLELREKLQEKEAENLQLRKAAQQIIQQKDNQIIATQETLSSTEIELRQTEQQNKLLQQQLREKTAELEEAQDKIKELEAKPKTVEASEPAWGSSSWGQQTGWGTQSGWGTTKEKTVEVDV